MWFKDKDRFVIPRWRDFSTTLRLGELKSLSNEIKAISGEKFLAEKVNDFEKHRTVTYAADLVATAYVLKKFDDAKDAAEFLLNQHVHLSNISIDVARRILGTASDNQAFETRHDLTSLDRRKSNQKIRESRQATRRDPRNSIEWTDLAREYAVQGFSEKAKKAMDIAIGISPHNRFVLRSAARLYLHLDDSKFAFEILRRSPSTRFDPWLIAAEIAVSEVAKKTSRYAKEGLKFLESASVSPLDLSELASALGTLEISHGNSKKGKKFFRQSLISPNENAVAQVEWASRKYGLFSLDQKYLQVPSTFEARALVYMQAGNWEGSLREAKHWLTDQPFSSRPASHASFVAASMLEDYFQSEEIARRGLIANPNDEILLNNLAYSLAQQSKVDEAEEVFRKIEYTGLSEDIKIVWNATSGLIHYKKGEPEIGRALYSTAIQIANKTGDKKKRYLATLNLAQEELSLSPSNASDIVGPLITEFQNIEDLDLKSILSRIRKKLRIATESKA